MLVAGGVVYEILCRAFEKQPRVLGVAIFVFLIWKSVRNFRGAAAV